MFNIYLLFIVNLHCVVGEEYHKNVVELSNILLVVFNKCVVIVDRVGASKYVALPIEELVAFTWSDEGIVSTSKYISVNTPRIHRYVIGQTVFDNKLS